MPYNYKATSHYLARSPLIARPTMSYRNYGLYSYSYILYDRFFTPTNQSIESIFPPSLPIYFACSLGPYYTCIIQKYIYIISHKELSSCT